jgi:hypothetical protein
MGERSHASVFLWPKHKFDFGQRASERKRLSVCVCVFLLVVCADFLIY